METIEYTTLNRCKWEQSVCAGECDKKQWQDEETGLPCLIVRQRDAGHWCGYVGVAEGHPCYKEEQWFLPPLCNLECHGGVTFTGHCHEGAEEHGICHKPSPGEPDHVWWIGFDCAHSGDISPYDLASGHRGWRDGNYRSQKYVEYQCRQLAKQLAAMAVTIQ